MGSIVGVNITQGVGVTPFSVRDGADFHSNIAEMALWRP
jgi:hypothetical protein